MFFVELSGCFVWFYTFVGSLTFLLLYIDTVLNEFLCDGELIYLPFGDALLRNWWSAPIVGMEIAEEDKRRFPIRNIDGFIELFQSHVQRSVDEESAPNLAFLSILLGYLENTLTLTDQTDSHTSYNDSMSDSMTSQHLNHVANKVKILLVI